MITQTGALDAQAHPLAGATQAVIPVAAKAFSDVPRAALTAASGGVHELAEGSSAFL